MGIDVDLVEFPKFLASGERDGWQAQQEGEAGSLHTLEAKEESRGERGTGA